MKKVFCNPTIIFGLLDTASLCAVALGAYLGATLSYDATPPMKILAYIGILLWAGAWIVFGMMCGRLRKGESAFTPASGRTLQIISQCMVGLAAVTVLSALIGSSRGQTGFWLIELVILPGVFLGVAVAAQILRGLLTHAMALEEEQEGVV